MKEAALKEMKKIYIEILRIYRDFHTTSHFGESKEIVTHHIATRGKSMKGALIFLIQDREGRIY